AAPAHDAARAPHAALYGDGVRAARAVSHARRSPVSLAPTVRAAWPRGSQHRRGLPGASRPAPHDAGRWAGTLGGRGARPITGALECDRAADADGPARPKARARPAILDRWMGRLPRAATPSARLPRYSQAGEPGRDRR